LEVGGLQDSHLGFCSSFGVALAFMAVDCQLSSEEGRRQLRSADSRTCVIKQNYRNLGDRCFVAAGPKL